MKTTTILKIGAAMAMVTSVYAGRYVPENDWSYVRLYGHARINNGYSGSDLNNIKNNFPIMTLEKAHGINRYAGLSEVAARNETARINERNASVKPLFYWNASVAYRGLYASNVNAPDNYFEERSGFPGGGLGYAFPDRRSKNLWVNIAKNVVERSHCEGVFVDAVQRSERHGELPLMEDLMSKLPGLVIHNGYYVTSGGGILAARNTLNSTDGVYVEIFTYGASGESRRNQKVQLDNLLEVPSDKYIVVHANNSDHKFSLACFLIIANNRSFYSNSSGFTNVYPSLYEHVDFQRRLGPPKGKATVSSNGNIYRREFEYASVRVNVKRRTSRIEWR